MNNLAVFCGNSIPGFADNVMQYYKQDGKDIRLGNAKIVTFSDGEIQIEINENIRLKDVFIIQSTCDPVNNNLVELLLMIDAFKRSSAERVTAVMPYYGYARQDKKVAPRVPISAKLVADMLEAAGANRVITMDLHSAQIQGFFNIPVDNLHFSEVAIPHLKNKFSKKDLVIVSPDAGGAERARFFAKRLDAEMAVIDKRRSGPNKSKAMAVLGDVKGKIAILVDDMVDTAGTLVEGAAALIREKAKEVHAACAHPVLSGPALERVKKSVLKSLTVTDSIPLTQAAQKCKKIEVVTVSKLFGKAILYSHRGDSVTSLFS